MTHKRKENLTVILFIILALACCFAGCKPSGYGCNGRSKYITGHKPNGY